MTIGSNTNQPIDLDAIKSDAIRRYGDLPGVEGIGISDRSLRIYIRNTEVRKQLPPQFQGVPIDYVVIGDIATDW